MDDKSNTGKNNLALTGVSVLAKIIGIAVPYAKPLPIIVDVINDRRNKKHLKRLEKLIQCLDRRLTQLEDKIPETPDPDLFDEIVAKAVSDEDEDKTELYAALVQYWLEHKPVPYEVRLLGNSIRELTIDEMECFFVLIQTRMAHSPQIPEQLQEIFWSRVIYLGLLKDADVKVFSNATLIGQKFIEIYQLSLTTK
jgi:hypothetical protein